MLAFSGFFSSSETALFSLSRSRVAAFERSERKSERTAATLLRTPRRLLVTILVGNNLVNIASASIATSMAIALLDAAGSEAAVGEGMLWATIGMTAVLLLFGEIAPKSLAIERADWLAPIVAPPLALFASVIRPIRIVLERTNDRLLSLVQHAPFAGPGMSSEELASAVDMGHFEGAVDAFEREVINNIIDLEDRTVGEIMTPRVEVESLDAGALQDEWVRRFRTTGFSRLPVVDADLDRVEGVFYAKDLLAARARQTGEIDLKSLLREPWFVPESMRLLDLLGEFRERQLHFALVIDEYGSVAGVVTMEDLLEEIVGDISDSRDQEEAPFKLLAPGIAVVYAGWDLEEFAAATGVDLQDEHAETVGGWLVNRLGRIPVSGEDLVVRPFQIHVLAARPTRVLWLRAKWKDL